MKKTHIAALILIAASIAIIVATTGSASTYGDFDEAAQLASTGSHGSIHVVGELKKDSEGNIIGLEKSPDLLSCSFILVDQKNREQKVYYNEPMPPDLTRSEKVVVVGGYDGEDFVASKILLKCPSKYEEKKLNAGIN